MFCARSNEECGLVLCKRRWISLVDLLHIYSCTHCLIDKIPSAVTYHTSGCYTAACHRGVPGSRSRQCVWDLSWTELQWDRLYSEYFGFVKKLSFHPLLYPFAVIRGKASALITHNLTEPCKENLYILHIYIYVCVCVCVCVCVYIYIRAVN